MSAAVNVLRWVVDAHVRSVNRRRVLVLLVVAIFGYCFAILGQSYGLPAGDAVGLVTRGLAALVFFYAIKVSAEVTTLHTDLGRSSLMVVGILALALAIGVARLLYDGAVWGVVLLVLTFGYVWWAICLADGTYTRRARLAGIATATPTALEVLAHEAADLRAEGLIDHAEIVEAALVKLTLAP